MFKSKRRVVQSAANLRAKASNAELTSLMVCRESPYPPRGGTPLRMWQHVNTLARLGNVHVISIGKVDAGIEMPIATTWQNYDPRDFPKVQRSLFMRALSIFRPLQYPYGVPERHLDKAITDALERIKPDMVVLSHWENGFPRVLRLAPFVVVDSHNIEWKLRADGAFPATSRNFKKLRIWIFKRREKALYERADRVWVTSQPDLRILKNFAPHATAAVVIPNAIDNEAYAAIREGLAQTSDLAPKGPPTMLFVGALDYKPNEEAALSLINEILPEVLQRVPSCRLLIVGRDASPHLIELAKATANVILATDVPDVRPFLAVANVAVIPLRVGGGTRVKILEALAARVPVVSSSKGAEGIAGNTGSDGIIVADSLSEMSQAIVSILQDSAKQKELGDAGFARVERDFSWAQVSRTLIEALPLHPINGS